MNFCDKENVNILTSLLIAHGVRHAFVCPGSRNAPIVHNLNECEEIACHPVTDERSAGFQAMGLSMAEGYQPVVVCVTSGSALLNLYPAVAEAFYQHIPLIVISADRPSQWIDQMDGQTIPQPYVFEKMAKKSVSLPEVQDKRPQEEQHWYCNRLVNECLIACLDGTKGPVHINVPISEPLYTFTTPQLPRERKISIYDFDGDESCHSELSEVLSKAQRPWVILGQSEGNDNDKAMFKILNGTFITLSEALNIPSHFEKTLPQVMEDERWRPDLIIYMGGHIVSKRLKQFLRNMHDIEQWRVSPSGNIEDTFMHLTKVIKTTSYHFAEYLANQYHPSTDEHIRLWKQELTKERTRHQQFELAYSSMAAILYFHKTCSKEPYVIYGNSSAIRLGNLFANAHLYCNRGVNGIEGTLSTAVGFSISERHADKNVYCILGDLSFFYDQNALWNQNLRGNLRIMVLNNGGGAIFGKFQGLKQSKAREEMVMAEHHTSAEGICKQNKIVYLAAHNMEEMKTEMEKLIKAPSYRPMLLEVFTDIDIDNKMMEEYFKQQ